MQAWTCWRLDGGGIGPPVPAGDELFAAPAHPAAPKSPVGSSTESLGRRSTSQCDAPARGRSADGAVPVAVVNAATIGVRNGACSLSRRRWLFGSSRFGAR